MAITVSGTTITFNDATTQTTAAVVSTTTVLNATAGASAGAVGTYMWARYTVGNLAFGSTAAGSNLRPQSAMYLISAPGGLNRSFTDGAAQSGTWRAMGTYTIQLQCCSTLYGGATLWLRIS